MSGYNIEAIKADKSLDDATRTSLLAGETNQAQIPRLGQPENSLMGLKPWWLTGAEFGISSVAQIGAEAGGAALAAPAAVGEATDRHWSFRRQG